MSNRLLAGRYELIEKIGEGGMAVVYKGKDRLLNRYVAIKILRPEFTKDESFIDNFRKESQAAARLTHPNIVSVYDVGKEGNIHFIVMELVEGRPLSQIIEEKGRLDYREAIEITRQVASALSLAHKNQIIHRDVKPHNILITDTGVAKLADFGIAKAVSSSTLLGGENKVIGSVHYLSPEQARGAYVDERTDIYSLGIVLYEMMTGKVPFDGDNPITIALMHINDQMTPPSKVVSGIPPQLEKVVLKATDKYQSNRYRSADEMIEDLDNIDFITKVVGNSVFSDGKDDHLTDTRKVGSTVIGTGGMKNVSEEELWSEKNGKEKRKSDDGGKKKPKDKMMIFIIVAAILLAVVGIFGLGTMLGWFDKDEEIAVPDLRGYTYEEAEKEAEKLGLKLEEGEHLYSPEYDEGQIMSQSPSEGIMVKPGKVITVNISKGKDSDAVPKVIGMNYQDVEAYLEEWGFALGVVRSEESEQPKDTVIGQDPEPGSTAEAGTKINIVISDGQGKKTTVVPKVVGLTVDQAMAALSAANLSPGDISYEPSDTVPKNQIISQNVAQDTEVTEGTKVGIVVSKGPEQVVPEPPDEPDEPGTGDDSDDDPDARGDSGDE